MEQQKDQALQLKARPPQKQKLKDKITLQINKRAVGKKRRLAAKSGLRSASFKLGAQAKTESRESSL